MKVLFLSLMALFAISITASAQKIPERFQGKWEFAIPNGYPGLDKGIRTITADSMVVYFTEFQLEVSAEWLKFQNDTLYYILDIEGVKSQGWSVLEGNDKLKAGYVNSESRAVFYLARIKEE